MDLSKALSRMFISEVMRLVTKKGQMIVEVAFGKNDHFANRAS